MKKEVKKLYDLNEINKLIDIDKPETYTPTLQKMLKKIEAKVHTGGKPTDKTWADMYNHLLNDAVKANCQQEIEVYVARLGRRTNKLQRYFNSTPLRQVFARVLVLGRATNRLYTISEISDVLSASRQAVSKMIDETEAEGWAEVYRDNNRVQCQASSTLYAAHAEYTLWRKELTKTVTYDAITRLFNFEDLMSTHITPDHSRNVKPDDIDH